MRHAWRRCGVAAVMVMGLAAVEAVPATAGEGFPYVAAFEIRVLGANGVVRDFLARSAQDQRGAVALLSQIDGAVEGPVGAIAESAVMLPHYRVEVRRLAPTYVVTPWVRAPETSFIYFPRGHDSSFIVVEFAQGRATLEQRWIVPDPDVAALLDRYLRGLPPIGQAPQPDATASSPWNTAVGLAGLVAIGLLAFGVRRRPRSEWKERSAGKGTNQRSLPSTVGKFAAP